MIWRDYVLGNVISKTTDDTRLWQSEKGIIELEKDTLVIPIKLGDQEKGYIFHGNGKLLLDTIVETKKGAIGKPTEKELNKPFLMLGDTEETKQHLIDAGEEELKKIGYETRQEFLDNAEELFNRFFKNGRTHRGHHFGEHDDLIFAFQHESDKLDLLVAKGPKLVYTARDVVFVSNKNNVVLKSPDEVAYEETEDQL